MLRLTPEEVERIEKEKEEQLRQQRFKLRRKEDAQMEENRKRYEKELAEAPPGCNPDGSRKLRRRKDILELRARAADEQKNTTNDVAKK